MVLTHAFRKALAIGGTKTKKLTKKSKSPSIAFFQDDSLELSFVNQQGSVYVQGHGGISRYFKQVRLLTNPQEKINKMSNAFHMPIENLEWKTQETIPFVLCPAGELYISSKNPLRLLSTNRKIDTIQDTYVNISQAFYMSQFPITCYLYDWVMVDADDRWARKRIESERDSEPMYKNPYPKGDESYWNKVEFCNRLSVMLGFDEVYEIKEKRKSARDAGDFAEVTKTVTRRPNKKGVRLPTILEWMYAANANSDFKYAGSNDVLDVGYSGNIDYKLATKLMVGEKKPNAWGIHDMSGFLEYPVEDTIQELLSRKMMTNVLENVPTTSKKQQIKLETGWGEEEMKKSTYTEVGCAYNVSPQRPMWTVGEFERDYDSSDFAGFFVVLDIF